jgi:outer membrane protein OmpA-like peptidoglycan-associated protein
LHSTEVLFLNETPEDSVLYQDFYLRPLPPNVAAFDKNYTLYFDFDKASLNDSSILVLKSLAKLLSLHTNWKLRIDGFADAKGADAYNLKLSKKRTEVCFLYLKALIINSKSIITSFFGEAKPIAPNTLESGIDNPSGRQLNRRVSLSVIMQ